MDLIGEFFIEILFRRIIAGFFGYYTLLAIYRVLGDQKRIEWLQEVTNDEGNEFGKGCFVGIVGVISFSLLLIGLGLLYDAII